MKRILSIKPLLTILVVFFTLCVNAQFSPTEPPSGGSTPLGSLGTIGTNGGTNGDILIEEIELGCDEPFSMTVQLILDNLESTSVPSLPWINMGLPANAPDMYIVFTINGIEFSPMLIPGFSSMASEPYSECFVTSPEVIFTEQCEENENTLEFSVHVKLVTLEGEMWVDYPACEYIDLFPCDVFYLAPWCSAQMFIPGEGGEPIECYDAFYDMNVNYELTCDCIIEVSDADLIPRNDSSVKEFNIFPNPFQDYITVCVENTESEIYIYDAKNNLIYQGNIMEDKQSEIQINTSNFSSGLYIIKTVNKDEVRSHRLVKN